MLFCHRNLRMKPSKCSNFGFHIFRGFRSIGVKISVFPLTLLVVVLTAVLPLARRVFVIIFEGNIMKTKQVRPQRRLLGGESAVEGDCISPLKSPWYSLKEVSCWWLWLFYYFIIISVVHRPHCCSSLLFPQSLSPSQSQCSGIHSRRAPEPQWNSPEPHGDAEYTHRYCQWLIVTIVCPVQYFAEYKITRGVSLSLSLSLCVCVCVCVRMVFLAEYLKYGWK